MTIKRLHLADLIDIEVLQQIQDWFSATTGIPAVIRDADGRMITKPSGSSEFCALVSSSAVGRELCSRSHREAVRKLESEEGPAKYVCHAGLTQFAAPIRVKNHYFGSIVVGDRPQTRFSDEQIRRVANECDVAPETLGQAFASLTLWSEEDMSASTNFLHSIANTLAQLCYQGYQLQASFNELSTLYEVGRRLTGKYDLQEVLDLIVHSVAEALDVKACSLRLLDDSGEELVPKAVYGLSRRYLQKGPVLLAKSQIDQAALRGEAVYMADMTTDKRVLYPEAAKAEGLRSGLAVGMVLNDQSIGTIHVYTVVPHEFTERELRLFNMLAGQGATAIESAKLHEARLREDRIDRELALAGEIQARLLPRKMPQIEGFDIVAKSFPSQQVGGDFYDFIRLPENHLGVVIGDVSGKSVSGAILMAAARMALRAQVATTYAAKDIVAGVNDVLCRDTRPMEFVTLFYGAIDVPNRRLTYCNGGHGGALLFRDGAVQELLVGGTVIGSIEWAEFEEDSVDLRPGDILFLHTDGVVEAMNPQEELFGQRRLIDTMLPLADAPAGSIVSAVHQAVRQFARGAAQSDDIALVVIRVL